MTTTIVAVAPTNVVVIPDPCLEDGEWWKTDGVEDEDVVAAYAAKGAASYAASKVNLANPGTYDLTQPDGTIDWNSTDGWIKGTNGKLINTISSSASFTLIIRCSGIVDSGGCSHSIISMNASIDNIGIDAGRDLGEGGPYAVGYGSRGISEIVVEPSISQGVLALSYSSSVQEALGYRNGSKDGDTLSTTLNAITSTTLFETAYDCNIQACAIYNKALSATQIAAITDAMEAL